MSEVTYYSVRIGSALDNFLYEFYYVPATCDNFAGCRVVVTVNKPIGITLWRITVEVGNGNVVFDEIMGPNDVESSGRFWSYADDGDYNVVCKWQNEGIIPDSGSQSASFIMPPTPWQYFNAVATLANPGNICVPESSTPTVCSGQEITISFGVETPLGSSFANPTDFDFMIKASLDGDCDMSGGDVVILRPQTFTGGAFSYTFTIYYDPAEPNPLLRYNLIARIYTKWENSFFGWNACTSCSNPFIIIPKAIIIPIPVSVCRLENTVTVWQNVNYILPTRTAQVIFEDNPSYNTTVMGETAVINIPIPHDIPDGTYENIYLLDSNPPACCMRTSQPFSFTVESTIQLQSNTIQACVGEMATLVLIEPVYDNMFYTIITEFDAVLVDNQPVVDYPNLTFMVPEFLGSTIEMSLYISNGDPPQMASCESTRRDFTVEILESGEINLMEDSLTLCDNQQGSLTLISNPFPSQFTTYRILFLGMVIDEGPYTYPNIIFNPNLPYGTNTVEVQVRGNTSSCYTSPKFVNVTVVPPNAYSIVESDIKVCEGTGLTSLNLTPAPLIQTVDIVWSEEAISAGFVDFSTAFFTSIEIPIPFAAPPGTYLGSVQAGCNMPEFTITIIPSHSFSLVNSTVESCVGEPAILELANVVGTITDVDVYYPDSVLYAHYDTLSGDISIIGVEGINNGTIVTPCLTVPFTISSFNYSLELQSTEVVACGSFYLLNFNNVSIPAPSNVTISFPGFSDQTLPFANPLPVEPPSYAEDIYNGTITYPCGTIPFTLTVGPSNNLALQLSYVEVCPTVSTFSLYFTGGPPPETLDIIWDGFPPVIDIEYSNPLILDLPTLVEGVFTGSVRALCVDLPFILAIHHSVPFTLNPTDYLVCSAQGLTLQFDEVTTTESVLVSIPDLAVNVFIDLGETIQLPPYTINGIYDGTVTGGCNVQNFTFTYVESPSAVFTTLPRCEGDNVILQVTNITGDAYEWSYETLSGPLTSEIILPPMSGGDIVINLNNGTCVNGILVNIPSPITPPTVTLSGGTTICRGDDVVIPFTVEGEYPIYITLNGVEYMLESNTLILTWVEEDITFILTGARNVCFGTGSGTFTVTVVDRPTLSYPPFCKGEFIIPIFTPSGGTFSSTAVIDVNTGIIDTGSSTNGVHNVIYTHNDIPCDAVTTIDILPLPTFVMNENSGSTCDATFNVNVEPDGVYVVDGIEISSSGGILTINTPSTTGVVYIARKEGECIGESQPFTITVDSYPVFQVLSSSLNCGDTDTFTLTLQNSNAISIEISFGSVIFTGSVVNNIATLTSDVSLPPGVYEGDVTLSNDICSTVSNYTLTVNVIPVFTITPVTLTMCEGERPQVTLYANVDDFRLTFSDGTIVTEVGDFSFEPVTESTTITVISTETLCDAIFNSVTVTVIPNVQSTIQYPDAPYCDNITPVVTPLGGYFYSAALLDINTGTVDVFNTPPGTYTVNYVVTEECVIPSSTDITINPIPRVEVNDLITCEGDTYYVPITLVNVDNITLEVVDGYVVLENLSLGENTINGQASNAYCTVSFSFIVTVEECTLFTIQYTNVPDRLYPGQTVVVTGIITNTSGADLTNVYVPQLDMYFDIPAGGSVEFSQSTNGDIIFTTAIVNGVSKTISATINLLSVNVKFSWCRSGYNVSWETVDGYSRYIVRPKRGVTSLAPVIVMGTCVFMRLPIGSYTFTVIPFE